MSEIQELIDNLGKALGSNQITEDMCYALRDALKGVPEVYHLDALKALIRGGADRA